MSVVIDTTPYHGYRQKGIAMVGKIVDVIELVPGAMLIAAGIAVIVSAATGVLWH